MAPSCFKD